MRVLPLKMVELTYVGANIQFPCSVKETWPDKPYAELNRVIFVHKGHYISADIKPYCIPFDMSKFKIVQEEIIQPAVKLVTSDLDTIMEQLSGLHTLAEMKIVHPGLEYERASDGREFKVYESSRISPSEEESLFQKVMLFKGIDKRILKSHLHRWVDLAEFVKQEQDVLNRLPHVEGTTLKEALERAINIYGQETVLRNTFG